MWQYVTFMSAVLLTMWLILANETSGRGSSAQGLCITLRVTTCITEYTRTWRQTPPETQQWTLRINFLLFWPIRSKTEGGAREYLACQTKLHVFIRCTYRHLLLLEEEGKEEAVTSFSLGVNISCLKNTMGLFSLSPYLKSIVARHVPIFRCTIYRDI